MLPRTLVSTALLGNVFKCFEPSFVSTKCCCMAVPPLRPSVLLSKPQASASASAGCRWVRGGSSGRDHCSSGLSNASEAVEPSPPPTQASARNPNTDKRAGPAERGQDAPSVPRFSRESSAELDLGAPSPRTPGWPSRPPWGAELLWPL